MKINWGTGIVLAFIAFISFIMYFVINMNVQSKYDHDLVTDTYYEEELKYQSNIDKERNALQLTTNLQLKQSKSGVEIQFPKTIDSKKIKGKVFLYRPSNKQFDFEIPISLSHHTLLIPDNRLLDGRWNIKVDWSDGDTEYLFKEEIQY
ncbi:FixH [Kordia sp. SMS9]|uniref:FixH family protein n=1 Tax=Kordia sp. SMS9 TaxID=2282170 RepID=UPI000E0CF6C9|nr:FixH family protein [Kordia sp. SMS9]AXG68565.1 FixH [Kordia sp. SMS9]